MSLRVRLVLSFSAIILSSIAMLTFAFYHLLTNKILEDNKTLLASLNSLTVKFFENSEESDSLEEWYQYLKNSDTEHFKLHALILISPDDQILTASAGESNAMRSEFMIDFIKNLNPESAPTGHFERNGLIYIWAINKLTRTSNYLLQIRIQTSFINPQSQYVIYNMIGASILIMWFSIWTVLIFATRISNKLDSQQEKLEFQANFDALTELPNKNNLIKTLDEYINDHNPEKEKFALLLLDINNFKIINDTLGHEFGDRLLNEMAIHLKKILKSPLLISRPGGDEFAILISIEDYNSAAQTAHSILDSLKKPIFIDDQPFHVDISIGITVYPDHGENTKTLLRHVEVAMYRAKKFNSGFIFYSRGSDPHSKEKLKLIGELHRALEKDEFVLFYQPKIFLNTGELYSAESLVRWIHPVKGKIPPGEFIPLAEQTYLIKTITEWIIENAMKNQLEWKDKGMDIPVAVNLSARNIHDFDLPRKIETLLTKYNFEPSSLILEITETAIISDPEKALIILSRLNEMGLKISLDDFGRGYTSLSQLISMPLHELKIDQSFITKLAENSKNSMIVKAIIDMSHNIGLKVVAEGIENEETQELMNSFSCDIGQGYHISRPLEKNVFLAWFFSKYKNKILS